MYDLDYSIAIVVTVSTKRLALKTAALQGDLQMSEGYYLHKDLVKQMPSVFRYYCVFVTVVALSFFTVHDRYIYYRC